jgi:hypothetical protein
MITRQFTAIKSNLFVRVLLSCNKCRSSHQCSDVHCSNVQCSDVANVCNVSAGFIYHMQPVSQFAFDDSAAK